jgi:hypothetical protein
MNGTSWEHCELNLRSDSRLGQTLPEVKNNSTLTDQSLAFFVLKQKENYIWTLNLLQTSLQRMMLAKILQPLLLTYHHISFPEANRNSGRNVSFESVSIKNDRGG